MERPLLAAISASSGTHRRTRIDHRIHHLRKLLARPPQAAVRFPARAL